MVARHSSQNLAVGLASLLVLFMSSAYGYSTTSTSGKAKSQVSESAGAQKHISHLRHHRRRHHYYERFYTSSFANDVTAGDVTDGEDLSVRAAAIDALGNMNGSVVAIDPASGRILAMVNQKLAL